VTTIQSANLNAAQQYPSKLFRSADGRMRADYGDTSVLTKAGDPRTFILDHIKKEVRMIQPPQLPQMPLPPVNPPQPPGFAPPAGPPHVEDLGKRLIDGIEAEGKRYMVPLPNPPQAPNAPQTPQPPMITEVWTAVKSKIPVLTKVTGPFGEQLCKCRIVEDLEPNPQLFDIPADYKQAPEVPRAPAPPKPAIPKP
jgi:hypothetical protein